MRLREATSSMSDNRRPCCYPNIQSSLPLNLCNLSGILSGLILLFPNQTAYEFLAEEKLIPFVEATIRVFDRHGERVSRHKARIKYLINKIGVAEFLKLVAEEEASLLNKTVVINRNSVETELQTKLKINEQTPEVNEKDYNTWFTTNTFKQKQ